MDVGAWAMLCIKRVRFPATDSNHDAALPDMAVLRGMTRRFSGRGHIQSGDKTNGRRNLIMRQCPTTGRQDLALDIGRPVNCAGALGLRSQNDVRDDDGSGDQILP